MFPPGLPGLALLLLRVSVAIALVLHEPALRQDLSGWMHAAAALLSLALCAGYLTPIVALMGLALHLAVWFAAGTGSPAMAIVISLDALALALLGPGAYSVDSYRFGRRVVVLPPP